MSDRWWTSDMHYGHANIIKYCDRPFSNVDDMNDALVDRWNDTVGDNDEVWIIGDLILGNLRCNLSAHVARLKGTKILVPGNHDVCWQHHRKGPRNVPLYHDLGGITHIIHDPKPVVLANKPVHISHFPYRIDTHHDLRYLEHYPADNDGWLLHGHIHEKWRQNGRQINVGVDAWDFAPVNDDTLSEIIKSGPQRVDCPTYQTAA